MAPISLNKTVQDYTVFLSTSYIPNLKKITLLLLDGNFLAVGSHDNFVYIYAVTENGKKYSRVGKCTVSNKDNLIDWKLNPSVLKTYTNIFVILFI